MASNKFTYPGIYNKIIEWGIIFLIVFTPIAFGTVNPLAYTIMELTVCFLIIIWIVRLWMININKTTMFPRLGSSTRSNQHGSFYKSKQEQSYKNGQSTTDNHQSLLVNRLGFIKTPLTIPVIVFVGLILFQLIPLPPRVLNILSPNTFKLYETTLPDWQTDESSNQQINKSMVMNLESANIQINKSSILESQISSPSWQSISVYRHATKTELYKILSYIGIFFLIVNYNPSSRSRQPISGAHRSQIKTFITHLIITMIVVGCFESVYGLLEYLSEHQHIFFEKKTRHLESVTGTYWNRNHFAGYMALVICISIGYLTCMFSRTSNSKASGWRQKLGRIINMSGTRAGLISFLALIMSTALVLSGSRMGICSFVIAIILMSILLLNKTEHHSWKIYIIKKISLILIPICLLVLWIGINPVINRFSNTSRDLKSESNRIGIWKDSSGLIKDFPALGTGLGTYEYVFPKYKTFDTPLLYDHAHNDYLELISDTGFLGLVIVVTGFTYLLLIVFKILLQSKNSFVRGVTAGCLGGFAYIMLHSLTDFNLQIPANAMLLSVITGIMHKTVTQL